MKDCTGRELAKYDIVAHACSLGSSSVRIFFGRVIELKEKSCKLEFIEKPDSWDNADIKKQGYKVRGSGWLKSSDRVFKISDCEDFFAFKMIKDSYVKQEMFTI